MTADDASRAVSFQRMAPGEPRQPVERNVARETPVAVEFNGIGYAVLMCSPADLEDLAFGFSFTERLIESVSDILSVSMHALSNGVVLRIGLRQDRAGRLLERVRHRVSESSCGVCGVENLEQALRPLPKVREQTTADEPAIFRALDGVRPLQVLNARTGGVHAAALARRDGSIGLIREDIGRHNAFDKLIGAMLRSGLRWDGGFAVLTSRCSYELVEKAALADCPMLVTISAPTSLAISRAAEANIRLIVLARSDAALSIPAPTSDGS